MVKNRSSSSPFASSLVTPSGRGSSTVPWPSICEYPISSLAVYRDLPSYSDICVLAIVLMASLAMLSAIRENTNESNAEFDSRPSVRFIKRNFFGTPDALVVAACLAVVPALGFIQDISPTNVENFIKASIANYKPNVKAPKQLNASNVEVWVNGQISRILGLINSCPASIAGCSNFGLKNGQASRGSMESLVRSMPLPNKPSVPFVINSFRIIVGIVSRDSDERYILTPPGKPLVFNEPPIRSSTGSFQLLGITIIEHELFTKPILGAHGNIASPGIEIKRELDASLAANPMEKTKVRPLDASDLERFLSSLELASYRSAAKLGNKHRLLELNQLVISRKEAQASGSNTPQVPENDTRSLKQFAQDTSSPSKSKRGRKPKVSSSPPSSSPSSTVSPTAETGEESGGSVSNSMNQVITPSVS